jgi:hypothetical protein
LIAEYFFVLFLEMFLFSVVGISNKSFFLIQLRDLVLPRSLISILGDITVVTGTQVLPLAA